MVAELVTSEYQHHVHRETHLYLKRRKNGWKPVKTRSKTRNDETSFRFPFQRVEQSVSFVVSLCPHDHGHDVAASTNKDIRFIYYSDGYRGSLKLNNARVLRGRKGKRRKARCAAFHLFLGFDFFLLFVNFAILRNAAMCPLTEKEICNSLIFFTNYIVNFLPTTFFLTYFTHPARIIVQDIFTI